MVKEQTTVQVGWIAMKKLNKKARTTYRRIMSKLLRQETGSALVLSFVLAIIGTILMTTGARMIIQSYKETRRMAHYVAEADNAARAGLVEALGWFRRQANGVNNESGLYVWHDEAFYPRNDVIVGVSNVSETLDETIGLVREYQIGKMAGGGELFIRYEVPRQNYPTTDAWGTPLPTPDPLVATPVGWNPRAAHDNTGERSFQQSAPTLTLTPTHTLPPTATPVPPTPTFTPVPTNRFEAEAFCSLYDAANVKLVTDGTAVYINKDGWPYYYIQWHLYNTGVAGPVDLTFTYWGDNVNNATVSIAVYNNASTPALQSGVSIPFDTTPASAGSPKIKKVTLNLLAGWNNIRFYRQSRIVYLDYFTALADRLVIWPSSCSYSGVPPIPTSTFTVTPTMTNTPYETDTPVPTATMTHTPTVGYSGKSAGMGSVWSVTSIGYAFQRMPVAPAVPTISFSDPSIKILAKSVASSEFWRMPINLPANRPAAIYTNNMANVRLLNKSRIDGGEKYGVAALTGTNYTTSGSNITVEGALGQKVTDSTMDLSIQGVFGLSLSDLRLLADYVGAGVTQMYSTAQAAPYNLTDDKFYFIDSGGPGHPVTFDDTYRFNNGSGLMIVNGDLVVLNNYFPPSNNDFMGLVYVTGSVILDDFVSIDGTLVALGGVTLSNSGTPADFTTVTRSESALSKIRQGVVSYRENQSAVRTMSGLPPDRR